MQIVRQGYRLSLTEMLLGTAPMNQHIYAEYIASRKAAATTEERAAETATVSDAEEAGVTGFRRDEDGLFLFDYQIRGFLKEAARVLNLKVPGKRQAEVALSSGVMDQFVFVSPRKVRIHRDGVRLTEPEGVFDRPLRALTMQGPRVTLARSEMVQAGAEIAFDVTILQGKVTLDQVEELLGYGQFLGLGQFRTGSFGRFTWERA